MNLRIRILAASTAMVLVSLTVLLLVGGGVIGSFSRGDRTETVALDGELFETAALLNGFNGDDEALSSALERRGYTLVICRGGETSFTSARDYQVELYENMSGVRWRDAASALSVGRVTVVGRSAGDSTLLTMSIVPGDIAPGGQPPVLGAFIFTGLLAFVPIIIMSLIFTGAFTRSIMRPLNELADAARRVERGDLSKPVLIHGRDEFAEVCETFNNMQLHLSLERDRNEAYEKARTELVSGISHDLRTPLTAVKGCIKGLQDGVAKTPEKREQYLGVAYERACEMEELLAKLLDFSRLETGQIPLELRRCELGAFAADYAAQLRLETEGRDITVETEIEPGNHEVLADRAQLRRVLVNLADNSLKYGEVSPLRIRISVYSDRDGEHIRFTDNGKGVPRSQLRKVFDEFWRGDSARSSRNAAGSGLGLHIVKFIVESHGGSVRALLDGGFGIDICLPRAAERVVGNENTHS